MSWIYCYGLSCWVVISRSQVRITSGNLALDVVTLAEEGEPIIKHLLVLWFEVFPLRAAFLLLQRRLC